MVALDIDGTLLDEAGVMPDHIKESVSRVLDAGVPVVLSTGRGWYATEPVFEALGLPPGPSVCSNGAVLVTYPPFELVEVATFDPEKVIRHVHALSPNARIAVEVIGKGFRLNKLFPNGDLAGQMTIETIDELCAEPASRVIVRDPDVASEEFLTLADDLGMHGVSYAVGWSNWLDIAPEGINKAQGLEKVCAPLGIKAEDVLAIGDGYNDIEMLAWAGRGVAMGQAADGVKVHADTVTGTFFEGGTSQELRRWF
ncbi:HAD family hydrolase [Propionibacteriaceae bacterium Y1923]|uniref:HAD family hydrolase n=1 Tax=Aestuariimicrobium sp. Y1814 TaxID=3418742 RepID=UPI003C1D3170